MVPLREIPARVCWPNCMKSLVDCARCAAVARLALACALARRCVTLRRWRAAQPVKQRDKYQTHEKKKGREDSPGLFVAAFDLFFGCVISCSFLRSVCVVLALYLG